jgi:hypothetical protein
MIKASCLQSFPRPWENCCQWHDVGNNSVSGWIAAAAAMDGQLWHGHFSPVVVMLQNVLLQRMPRVASPSDRCEPEAENGGVVSPISSLSTQICLLRRDIAGVLLDDSLDARRISL